MISTSDRLSRDDAVKGLKFDRMSQNKLRVARCAGYRIDRM
jgi:hypothetical protein